jgi:hypothetical protein
VRADFEQAEAAFDVACDGYVRFGTTTQRVDRGERTAALVDQFAEATQLLVAVDNATLADTARQYRGVALLSLGRTREARGELDTALAGFEARGQAENAARARDLLAQLGECSGSRTSD